jgi:hypothetical protein
LASFSTLSTATEHVKPKAGTKPKVVKARILGVGLDNEDGHTRLTRGENFTLYGGSEETHGRMQETAVKVNEQLQRRGKRLEDCSPREFFDIVQKASE